ncbi:YncE family protein [Nocardia sp. CA-151230]|uniref:YncE family protein n=1 Tax=Nocardia sp. CA-151230 TaxID=3239982 RepID=UPI003D8E12FE
MGANSSASISVPEPVDPAGPHPVSANTAATTATFAVIDDPPTTTVAPRFDLDCKLRQPNSKPQEDKQVRSAYPASVSVLDTHTRAVTATIAVDQLFVGEPQPIVIDPATQLVYILGIGTRGALVVIDPATDSVTARPLVEDVVDPVAVAIDSDWETRHRIRNPLARTHSSRMRLFGLNRWFGTAILLLPFVYIGFTAFRMRSRWGADQWGDFATWIAGIATSAAVLVALWQTHLARRDAAQARTEAAAGLLRHGLSGGTIRSVI